MENTSAMEDEPEVTTEVIKHATGSTYSGPIIHGRMEGKGEYLFPTGTKYIGDIKDGMYVNLQYNAVLYLTLQQLV